MDLSQFYQKILTFEMFLSRTKTYSQNYFPAMSMCYDWF